MKYLCMVFYDEKNLNALSATDLQALDDESLAYDETLRRRGHLIAAQALELVQAATTVRLRNGKVSVTDGPFAETNNSLLARQVDGEDGGGESGLRRQPAECPALLP